MNNKIKEMILQYEQEGDFTHAKVSDEVIAEAEHMLSVKLPEQYIEFLKEYGNGGICGVSTIGVGLDSSLIFVEETLNYRDEGLPSYLVVIENCDEWLYCIDTQTQKIVSWDMNNYIKPEYDSFDSYLVDQMCDAIENN